jgi:hypothetical protein
VPAGVLKIAAQSFFGCQRLTAILVDAPNANYSSLDGVLFDKGQTTLAQYPIGSPATDYTIPGSVTNIANWAFAYSANLTNITIPATVTGIGSGAFYLCSALRGIVIPSGLKTIPDRAFVSCTNLVNLTIPSSVTNIGNDAFGNCKGIAAIYFAGNAPTLGTDVFYNNTKATIYRLPGTTGWGSTFGGRPVVLWNPVIPLNDPGFGWRSNGFAITITGTTNIPVVLEGCTNLANRTWVPLLSGILTNGSLAFTDSDATNHPRRFYRVRSP